MGTRTKGTRLLAMVVIGMTLVAVFGIYFARSGINPGIVTVTSTQTSLRNGSITDTVTVTSTSATTQTETIRSTSVLTSTTTTSVSSFVTSTYIVTTKTTSTVEATSTVNAPSVSSIILGNTSIPGRPVGIAVNTNTSRIYIHDFPVNNLTVIDGLTHSIIDTVVLPGSVDGDIALDQNTNMVYVPAGSCTGGGTNVTRGCIIKVDGNTNTMVGTIDVDVSQLAVNPKTGMLYGIFGGISDSCFLGACPGNLLVINEFSGSLLANISLNGLPLGVSVDPVTNMVYVSACRQIFLPCVGAKVLGFSGADNSLRLNASLRNLFSLGSVLVDSTRNVVYTVGANGSNEFLISIGGSSGQTITFTALGGSCAKVYPLAVDTSTNQIYAALSQTYAEPEHLLVVIDAATGRISNMFSSASVAGAVFNDKTRQVYLTTYTRFENGGNLLFLPDVVSQRYVNTNLISNASCVP